MLGRSIRQSERLADQEVGGVAGPEDALSDTEHECLESLRHLAAEAERTPSGHGVKSGEWSTECPVSRTRYHEVRRRLLDHDYVSNDKGLYQLTANGEQALSACPPGVRPNVRQPPKGPPVSPPFRGDGHGGPGNGQDNTTTLFADNNQEAA